MDFEIVASTLKSRGINYTIKHFLSIFISILIMTKLVKLFGGRKTP